MVEGHEVWKITCRGCQRTRELTGMGNRLVGKHNRMRCTECGHRGADLLRVWTQGKAPASKNGRGT